MRINYKIEREKLAELEKICFPKSAYSLEQITDILETEDRYRVITVENIENDEVVAYVILFDNSESLEIMKIATLPQYRKKGLGTLLMEEISKFQKDIFLEVRENNRTARDFYIVCGFEEIGKRKNYYPDTKEAAILMMKKF